jgi:hypothetical protein
MINIFNDWGIKISLFRVNIPFDQQQLSNEQVKTSLKPFCIAVLQ